MADLHERLVAALRARLEVARAATDGPWRSHVEPARGEDEDWVIFTDTDTIGRLYSGQNANHVEANDPATEIRRVEALLRVVEGLPHPHWAIRELAAGEGIEP